MVVNMNEKIFSKLQYTTDELLDYSNLRKRKVLTSNQLINRLIIDELFFLEKLSTIYTQKYFNTFEVDVHSAISVANSICNMGNLDTFFLDDNYEKQYKNIIKYLVTRFNITSKNNLYEIENIEASFFKIKDNNNDVFNVRRLFSGKTNKVEDDIVKLHKVLGISFFDSNNDILNKNIFRLSDYYHKYGEFLSFYDTYFCISLDSYSKKIKEYNLICNKDFQLLINKLPINLYDQDGIQLLFKNKTEEVQIDDICFYHKFVYKLYGKKNDGQIYREVTENNYLDFNNFLLIANTKDGVAIYESSKGLQKYNDVIVDNEHDVDLPKNVIYLKSKKDYVSINLKDTFFNNKYYSQYLINHKVSFVKRLSLGIAEEKIATDAYVYIKGKKYYVVYIADDKSQKGRVLEYIINNLDIVEVEENIFEDDSSINYKIYVEESDIETLVLLDYLKRVLPAFKIYNISVTDLYHFILKDNYYYDSIVPNYQKAIQKHENKENNYYYKMQHVCNLIFEEIRKKYNISFEEAITLLNEKYINKELLSEKILNDLFRKLRDENNEDYRQLRAREEYGKTPLYYDKYVRQLDTEINRWKSEKMLYDLVHNLYQDAIYQYKNKWLGKQSLDIFIPSINIAIEYQGIQHYKQVNYFGDELDYNERKQNDETKKELCKTNNITLIEWLYNEPISEILLKEKLNLLNNNIVEETTAGEINKLNEMNIIKQNEKQSMLDEISNIISNMEFLIKSIEDMRESNKEIISQQTSLWCETIINSFKYEVNNAKEIQVKHDSDMDILNDYLKILNKKLLNIKNSLIHLEVQLMDDKERKKNDIIMEEQPKKIPKEDKKNSKIHKRGIVSELLASLFSVNSNKSNAKKTNLFSHKQDKFIENNYDDYQFEEEELEDDDYYNEDID